VNADGIPSPLHFAARNNTNPAIIETLVRLGAQVNARDGLLGRTPLHEAAHFGRSSDVLLKLLELGADPRARTVMGETPWTLIQENPELRDTPAFWRLNELRF
jgi:ankyrin repeat protein